MRLLSALEVMFGLVLLYGVVSQLAIPLINGTAIFPFFRKQHKLEAELTEARQEAVETLLEQQVTRERNRVRKTRKPDSVA